MNIQSFLISPLFQLFFFLQISVIIDNATALPEEPEKTYSNFYEWGLKAYTEERWYECAAFMRRALEDYKYEKSVSVYCRKKCNIVIPIWTSVMKGDPSGDTHRLVPYPSTELEYFDRTVRKSLCLLRCKRDNFSLRPNKAVPVRIKRDFDTLEPYSYMQLCYWNVSFVLLLLRLQGREFTS